MEQKEAEKEIKKKILELDPLNNFIRFENYWYNKTNSSKENFTSLIRDELPQQTYLNLAVWFYQLNLLAESEAILHLAPQEDDEIKYWLAYLHRNEANAKEWLDKADSGSPLFVFPFRQESAIVMQWAMKQTDNWRPRYYLALIENSMSHKTKALQLLKSIKFSVDFAPFYVTRAKLSDSSDTESVLRDYKTAVSLDKKDWRYGKYLTEFLMSKNQDDQALQTITPYYEKNPDNYIVGLIFTRCLMQNNKYNEAEKVLTDIHVLPFEGATNSHKLYEQTKLMLSLQLLQSHNYNAALQKVIESRKWPERLGVGKPYPDMINDSLENGIEKLIQQTMQGYKLSNSDVDTFMVKVKSSSMHGGI